MQRQGRPRAHRDSRPAPAPTATHDRGGRTGGPSIEGVPHSVRVAAAWSWRIVVIAAALAVLGIVIVKLHIVAVPVMVALLLAAALHPIVVWLERRRMPHTLAVVVVLVGAIVAVAVVLTVVVKAFVDGLPDLGDKVSSGVDSVEHWLIHGPLKLSDADVQRYTDSARKAVTGNREALTSGALSTAVTIGHVLTGLLFTFFTLLFFLRDGRRIWLWLLGLLPRPAREPLDGAGLRSFTTLISFVRATLVVAFVDGAGIGVWCAVLGVPLALPLGALVFIGAFVPLVGAVVSGIVAVIVALVAKGFFTALLVLLGVLAIQQLEGHVMQPLLLGRAVNVHPLAVVLGIGAGVLVAGIVGAVAAVPTIACLNTAVKHLVHRDDPPQPDPPPRSAAAAGANV